MDLKIIEFLVWPFSTLIVAVIFFIIFKDKLTEIEIDPGKRKLRAKFGQRVKQAKARAKGIEETVATNGSMSTDDHMIDVGKISARDIVIEAWGALKQIVYDSCTASQIALTPVTGIPDAVSRLRDVNAIDSDIASLIEVLHELGQELSNAKGLMPLEGDAQAYKELSNLLVDWMMLSILPRISDSDKSGVVRGRSTVVGEYFPQPWQGRPSALLVGIGGKVRGKRFPIDKEHYRIGSSSNNDLCIKDDDFISGNHAYIRYEKGSLFLFDQGSRNGTYLNDIQVTGTAVIVRLGDIIRLGKSILQISAAQESPSIETQEENESTVNQSKGRKPL